MNTEPQQREDELLINLSDDKIDGLLKGSRLKEDQSLIDYYTHQLDFSQYMRILPHWSNNHDNFKYADLR